MLTKNTSNAVKGKFKLIVVISATQLIGNYLPIVANNTQQRV